MKAFEGDTTRAFGQLVGAKSLESVIEIQSQYAKKAYDTWVAEASKLGEIGRGCISFVEFTSAKIVRFC